MRILLAVLIFLPLSSLADIVTVDFVKILNGNDKEAIYYYEKNWKQHRIKAMERGYINSYKLLLKTSDDGNTDILLITSYASESQYEMREENFAVVMQDPMRDGPLLLNEKLPGAFRDVVDGGVFSTD